MSSCCIINDLYSFSEHKCAVLSPSDKVEQNCYEDADKNTFLCVCVMVFKLFWFMVALLKLETELFFLSFFLTIFVQMSYSDILIKNRKKNGLFVAVGMPDVGVK